MYYLFLTKEKELSNYKAEFNRVKENIENGKTPVYNELRNAKTTLVEAIPYQLLSGIFLIIGTSLLDSLQINELCKIAVVLVVNNMCYALANYVFTYIKHYLRVKLCWRLGIEPCERNIAVMESLEYQSV